jgi:nitrogen regulatory protein P-II 1
VKKIEAIIKPFRLEDVKDALAQLGLQGMTLIEVKGCGHQRGHTEIYQGSEYTMAFVPKLKIILVVADSQVEAAVAAIMHTAKTGKIGDGKIFISTIDERSDPPGGTPSNSHENHEKTHSHRRENNCRVCDRRGYCIRECPYEIRVRPAGEHKRAAGAGFNFQRHAIRRYCDLGAEPTWRDQDRTAGDLSFLVGENRHWQH